MYRDAPLAQDDALTGPGWPRATLRPRTAGRVPAWRRRSDRRGRAAGRVPAAALLTVVALAAGGCGVGTSSSTTLFRIPNMTSQTLLGYLGHPTSRGPSGYPVVAGPDQLSLHGIQYTTQGRDALQSWLSTSSGKQTAAYKQAGRNLAVAFPSDKSEIYSKLK